VGAAASWKGKTEGPSAGRRVASTGVKGGGGYGRPERQSRGTAAISIP